MTQTPLQKQEIHEVLFSLGLKDREQQIYLCLLAHGASSMTPLARSLNMPPTTVQAVLERLYADGFVGVTKRKSRRVYEAHDPIILKRLLEEKIKEASNIIPLLQALQQDTVGTKTRIRIYERERMADIFHEALRAKNKLIYEIVAAKDLQKILGEKFHFTRRRKILDIKLKSLRVEAQEIKRYSKETHRRELREAKFLPRELNFRINLLFWDNTVAFFSTASEGLAWTVESVSLRETIQQLFDLLWSISRKMETAEEA